MMMVKVITIRVLWFAVPGAKKMSWKAEDMIPSSVQRTSNPAFLSVPSIPIGMDQVFFSWSCSQHRTSSIEVLVKLQR